LNDVFEQVLSQSALKVVSQVAIQPQLLDYCKVILDTEQAPPPDEGVNKVGAVAAFEVDDERK
jgi:hypothetical protein